MEDKVKVFLASGKLEEYIYGSLDANAQEEVLQYIAKYPEVNKEYQTLQAQLEKISRHQAITPPMEMKDQILESLPDKSQSTSPWIKYLSIATLAASFILAWGWINSASNLQIEKKKYETLASECEQRENQIETQRQQIAFLNSEQTQRFEIKGNQLAPEFNVMVFVNEALGKAIVTPLNELKLPNNKCLQLWGDLEGEMIPIAVINEVEINDIDVAINSKFTSLNFTIEEKTTDGKGQAHPDVSQLIANVII